MVLAACSRCNTAQSHVMDLPLSHNVTSNHRSAACMHSMHSLHSLLPSINESAPRGLSSNFQHMHGAVCRQLTHRPYRAHLPQTLSHKTCDPGTSSPAQSLGTVPLSEYIEDMYLACGGFRGEVISVTYPSKVRESAFEIGIS